MPFDLQSRAFNVLPDGTCLWADTKERIPGFDVTQSIPEASSSGYFGTYDENTDFLHRYSSPYAGKDKPKIKIPTTHIVGQADDYYKQGLLLRDLCLPQNRQFMEHRLGHDIPKDRNTTVKMANTIEQMLHSVLVG